MGNVIAIALCFLFIPSLKAPQAQGVSDSCLVLWQDSPLKPPNVAWFNTDSVLVDICKGNGHVLAEFAKRKFWITFLYYLIPDSVAPIGDSLEHNWQDIGLEYTNIRNAFDSIGQKFGAFTIQHVIGSKGIIGDTLPPGNKEWSVNFKNYQNVDSVLYYLSQFPEVDPHLRVVFGGRPIFFEGVKDRNIILQPVIWPQPVRNELFIRGVNESENIQFCDALGRKFDLPHTTSDGVMNFNVSTVNNGLYHCIIAGKVFKILIQK